MAIDVTAPRSRRALIAGAFGGVTAWALGALGRPAPARAAGDPVLLGTTSYASDPTIVHNYSSKTALVGHSGTSMADTMPAPVVLPGKVGVYGFANQDADAEGVHGYSQHGIGVHGFSDEKIAVYGSTGYGTGVYGSSTTGDAVWGVTSDGVGMHAWTTNGTGVEAGSEHALALHTWGRVKFEKVSGIATIRAGHTSVTVSPGAGVDIIKASFVLLTPRSDLHGRRIWYTLNLLANTITIHLSSAAGSSVQVGWLLLN
jgi:hypothetical protein